MVFRVFPHCTRSYNESSARARALGVDDDEWKALTFGRNKKNWGKYCWKMSLIISCLNPPHCWASAYLMQYTRAWAAAVEVMMMHAHSFFCFEHFTGKAHSPLAQSRVSQSMPREIQLQSHYWITIIIVQQHETPSSSLSVKTPPAQFFHLCHNLPTPNSRTFLTFSSWAPQICAPSTHRWRWMSERRMQRCFTISLSSREEKQSMKH